MQENMDKEYELFIIPDVEYSQHPTYANFADIWLLTTKDFRKKVDFDNVKIIDGFQWDYTLNKTKSKLSMDFLNIEDLKPHFTGIARIVHYHVKGWNSHFKKFDPYIDFSLNKFTKLIEGNVKDGKMDGFSRHIEGKQVQLGYYF